MHLSHWTSLVNLLRQASSTLGWKNCELEIWKYPPVLPHFFWWTFPLLPLCSSPSSLPSRQHQKLPFSVNFFALSTFLPSQLFLFSFSLSYMPSVYMYYFCLLPRTYMFWHIWFVFHHFIGLAHFTCRNLNNLPNKTISCLNLWYFGLWLKSALRPPPRKIWKCERSKWFMFCFCKHKWHLEWWWHLRSRRYGPRCCHLSC